MGNRYVPVIGLEVHAELLTRSKMFCGCAVVDSTQAAPNTFTCPVCTAMPGVLPVINKRAMDSILKYIELGKTEGRLIAGGEAAGGDGYFVKPTVIADIDSKDRIFQEEIFGPVLAVTKARDFDHALELANDSEYGLTGAVFTTNKAKADKAKRQFFVGNLYINRKCTGAMVGAHPFGGFNMSGTDSKAGGPDYLLQFVQGKAIAEKIG